MMNMDILEELEPSSELDLEPQFRERSNTWPLRPNRVELDSQIQNGGSPSGSEEANGVGMVVGTDAHTAVIKQEKGGGVAGDPLGLTGVKKSGARRNAWGASSYADLITNAIQGSPDRRLTLSQIYDWMVQNVPYFKDKGDSTSAAGWKNSIRHNLSLHTRFMRIQNEGTGKSSWWMINPDAKASKPPRRRAGSMDTKSGEKKRGRINKKKQEAIRSALENRGSPLNGSNDFLDTVCMGDFRSRASSNASSCSRLSPIPPDLHDNQVPPMSPIPWDGEVDVSTGFQGPEHFPELASSLADSMNLSSQDSMDVSLSCNLNSDPYLSSGGSQDFANTPETFKGLSDLLKDRSQLSPLGAPPPYPERTLPYPDCSSPAQTPQLQSSPMVKQEQPAVASFNKYNLSSKLRLTLMNKLKSASMYNTDRVSMLNQMNNSQAQLSVNTQQQTTIGTPEGSQQSSPNNPQSLASHLSPAPRGQTTPLEKLSPLSCQLSPQQQQQALLGSPDQQASLSPKIQQQNALQQQQQQQQSKSILRSALTHGSLIFSQPSSNNSVQFILGMTQSSPNTATNSGNLNTNIVNLGLSPEQHQIQQLQQQQQQQPQPQQQQLQQPQQMQLSSSTSSFLGLLNDSGSLTTGPVVNNVIMHSNGNTLSNGNNNLPADVQVDTGNFLNVTDYEFDQVINQELSLEGNLDATFDNIMPV